MAEMMIWTNKQLLIHCLQ